MRYFDIVYNPHCGKGGKAINADFDLETAKK